MTNSKLYISAIILAISCSGITMAQEGQRRGGKGGAPSFSDIDSGGDGVLSREEFESWSAAARERREQRTGNGDEGSGGMTGGGNRGGGDVFSRIDSDNDGSVTEAEFTAMLDKLRSRREGSRSAPPATDTEFSG
jgi:Ca2+-binding EF-hand superfamily protein